MLHVRQKKRTCRNSFVLWCGPTTLFLNFVSNALSSQSGPDWYFLQSVLLFSVLFFFLALCSTLQRHLLTSRVARFTWFLNRASLSYFSGLLHPVHLYLRRNFVQMNLIISVFKAFSRSCRPIQRSHCLARYIVSISVLFCQSRVFVVSNKNLPFRDDYAA